ncbi:MAG: hypothetical protein AAB396_02115 [Patescibacteria group bacterium]
MRKKIMVLCPCNGQNHCPEIFSDDSLSINRQIEITDDFGGKIFMSKAQFNVFIKRAKDENLV